MSNTVAVVAEVKVDRRHENKGRPIKFDNDYIAAFKKVVNKEGLLKGHASINATGVVVRHRRRPVSISLPTLSKYVKSGVDAVQLSRGRPAKAA